MKLVLTVDIQEDANFCMSVGSLVSTAASLQPESFTKVVLDLAKTVQIACNNWPYVVSPIVKSFVLHDSLEHAIEILLHEIEGTECPSISRHVDK